MKPGPAGCIPVTACSRLGFVPGLNGVRGLAVLFVLGNHTPLGRDGPLLPGGWSGMDIFFVLSGCLITALDFFRSRMRVWVTTPFDSLSNAA